MIHRTLLAIALLLSLASGALPSIAQATVWQVGPQRTYTLPSEVMNRVADGDTVEIDAGLYQGDVGVWTKSNLLLRGVGGYAHLDAAGKSSQGKAIWVIDGTNTTVENIEFSGCTVPDKNGAGIRQEGAGLTLWHCYFHDNEDGVLTGVSATSDILFEACEFYHNGAGDGQSHNMYIGHVRSFTLRFCYTHGAKEGHNVKSRAEQNYILYNRIMDEATGTASYDVDLPNGGRAVLLGNAIEKGPNAPNHIAVTFGEEGLPYPANALYVVHNTMVGEQAGAIFVNTGSIAKGTLSACRLIDNIFVGGSKVFNGQEVDSQANAVVAKATTLPFKNFAAYDYRLKAASSALPASMDAGSVEAAGGATLFPLHPMMQYMDPLDSATRSDSPATVGAFAIISNGNVAELGEYVFAQRDLMTTGSLRFPANDASATFLLYDAAGRECLHIPIGASNSEFAIDITPFVRSHVGQLFFYRLESAGGIAQFGKLLVANNSSF